MGQTLKISLESVVRESGIELKRSGSGRFLALCPFHREKTPSFTVYPNGKFHCFGCGEHGDAIDFVRKQRGLSYFEALGLLGGERPISNFRARQELLRKRQESLKASWRESDLAWTLGTLIRRCHEDLSNISPENLDDHALILTELETLNYQHDLLIYGDKAERAELVKELAALRLFQRRTLFRRDFDYAAWLRGVREPRNEDRRREICDSTGTATVAA